MAIDKTVPDIWQSALVDKIAELVGKEIITMYEDNELPLRKTGIWRPYPACDEEKTVELAIERVIGKIKLIMPDDVYDKIYLHPILDEYFDKLDDLMKQDRVMPTEKYQPYRTTSQRLSEVGMSARDFL